MVNIYAYWIRLCNWRRIWSNYKHKKTMMRTYMIYITFTFIFIALTHLNRLQLLWKIGQSALPSAPYLYLYVSLIVTLFPQFFRVCQFPWISALKSTAKLTMPKPGNPAPSEHGAAHFPHFSYIFDFNFKTTTDIVVMV